MATSIFSGNHNHCSGSGIDIIPPEWNMKPAPETFIERPQIDHLQKPPMTRDEINAMAKEIFAQPRFRYPRR